MLLNNPIKRIALLCFFGAWFAYKQYITASESFILDGFIFLFIGIIGTLVMVITMIRDRKAYKDSRKLTNFLPTSIGLLLIAANIILYYSNQNRLNSPTLISGFNDGGFNGFRVDFKTNGTYVMANGSGLGESYFFGTYELRDSIITLDKSDIDNCITTNTLVIRTEPYYSKDSLELLKSNANYITQINQNGYEINNGFRFRVTEDNRTK